MDGITSLREAVTTVPIPGAPPRLSKDGASVGLAFLDVALRQNHVRRLTERLSLIEHRAARCTTEVDISLGLLDEAQRDAGILYQKLRNRTFPPEQGDEVRGFEGDDGRGDLIWVPVSRLSHRRHSPIDVTDGEGRKLPRLTQYETSRLMASALYRLLRAILSTHPDAFQRTKLSGLLYRVHESRWLLQAALVTLLTERSRPAMVAPPAADTPGTAHGLGARYRDYALDVLSTYEDYLREYITLLDIAVNDYLLVVGLDTSQDEHLLAFDSPLHVEERAAGGLLRRPVRASGGAYRVDYRTQIPASLRAYHLVATTEPGLQIDTMYLSSDADAGIVSTLASDLEVLSGRYAEEQRTPRGERGARLLELELQACLGSLSELLRRRGWEASQAGLTLADAGLDAARGAAWAASSGEVIPNGGEAATNALVGHPLINAGTLARAAEEIRSSGLERDLNMGNDPASDRAHAYWRRDPSRHVVGQSIDVSASIFIRDASGSRPGSVITYVASVVGISYVIGAMLFASPFPFLGAGGISPRANVDATIAVLLLVPGFLYTRLDLPNRHSILGQLRTLPRFVAYVSITSVALFASAIAVGAGATVVRLALAFAVVVPTAVLVSMGVMSRMAGSDLVVAAPTRPRWARSRPRGSGLRRTGRPQRWMRELYVAPDAAFCTSATLSRTAVRRSP
jgi:hypothetical protein